MRLGAVFFWICVPALGHAGVIDFDITNDLPHFSGDGINQMAGPFNIDGYFGTITTSGLVGGTELGFDGAVGLGVGDGDFDFGDAWAFRWDIDVLLKGVTVLNLNSGNEVTLQSDDWIALGVDPNPSPFVSFDSLTGTYTLNGSQSGDDWAINDFVAGSGIDLLVTAGTDITFTNITIGEDNLELRSLSFASFTVPEPATWLYCATAGLIGVCRRRIRRMKKEIAEPLTREGSPA